MKDATRALRGGRDSRAQFGAVNPPVVRASTYLFEGYDGLQEAERTLSGEGLTYGTHATPTSLALEQALRDLEGGFRTRLQPSGLLAMTAPLLSFLSAGDHLLMTDSAYGPTRAFCQGTLKRFGVETTFYDPLIGGGIRDLIRPDTKVVFCESPGSWTFEVQDVPAIAEEARKRGVVVMLDNTWASPLFFKPFEHGVDLCLAALTKYVGGHADLLMGSVSCAEAVYPTYRRGQRELGLAVSPDDCALALRGLRTLPVRMKAHEAAGLALADWLMGRPEIAEILHPGMPHDPGHRIWKRDFLGASGLFGAILREDLSSEAHVRALLDGLELFGIGYSWGAFESLILPVDPVGSRSATAWPREGRAAGRLLRLHAGLEAVEDLKADLEAGFARMAKV
ncbi:cystathionine beta-lyase [Neomegalonema sp.]|uniref:cystathionine beta-lyase n=1 Tax=Neomegalonema sp. TaxID=2039713 RepID=UPI0026048443|nr:cystathionine beta-lyase [Neomegalonema sp.]MDD2867927.1 cystathionine beta-lyase [Neomegalonema sp.]